MYITRARHISLVRARKRKKNSEKKETPKIRRGKRRRGESEANGGGAEQDRIHEEVGHRPQAPSRRYASSVFPRIRFLRPDLVIRRWFLMYPKSLQFLSYIHLLCMLVTEFRNLYRENLSRIYESNFGEKQYFRLFLLLDAK